MSPISPVLVPLKERPKAPSSFIGAIDSRKGIFDVLECFAKNKEMLQNKIIYHIGGTGDTKL